MEKEENKPRARGDPTVSPYEDLCGKPLTEAEEAEITFNLVNFVETLIAMDRQHQEWLEAQKEQTKTA